MSEAFDITKDMKITKKLKDFRDQNPGISREDLARLLVAHFNRTITADNIDAGVEYLLDHNLAEEKPTESPPKTPPVAPGQPPGTQPAQNEAPAGGSPEAAGRQPGDTKTPPNEAITPPVDGQEAP